MKQVYDEIYSHTSLQCDYQIEKVPFSSCHICNIESIFAVKFTFTLLTIGYQIRKLQFSSFFFFSCLLFLSLFLPFPCISSFFFLFLFLSLSLSFFPFPFFLFLASLWWLRGARAPKPPRYVPDHCVVLNPSWSHIKTRLQIIKFNGTYILEDAKNTMFMYTITGCCCFMVCFVFCVFVNITVRERMFMMSKYRRKKLLPKKWAKK